tara:strand:+ start:132 stop:590 length:459 start_codon:yes stop_codon:yes gene_type:complete
MKITRQRLKNIIMEEMASLDIDNTGRGDGENAPADSDQSSEEIGEISEGEGMELVQQAAQTLIDAGILGANSPEELMMALKGLGKAALIPLAGVAMGSAAMAGKDALAAAMAKDAVQPPDMPLEEEQEGTLEELITQAIQEELEQISQRNVN